MRKNSYVNLLFRIVSTRSNQRHWTLRSNENKNKQSNGRNKRNLDFSVYNNKLLNLNKRKKKQTSKKDSNTISSAKKKSLDIIGVATALPPKEPRPICQAMKAAMNAIGKISWYECNLNIDLESKTGSANENDGDVTYQSVSIQDYADQAIAVTHPNEKTTSKDKVDIPTIKQITIEDLANEYHLNLDDASISTNAKDSRLFYQTKINYL